jgi:hypothetical protein
MAVRRGAGQDDAGHPHALYRPTAAAFRAAF